MAITPYPRVVSNPILTGTTSTQAITRSVRVVTSSGDITISTTDDTVIVNKTVGGATVVNFPAGTLGREITIKDGKSDAATNNITLTPAAGNIDGASTFIMNINKQAVTVRYDGTQWEIV